MGDNRSLPWSLPRAALDARVAQLFDSALGEADEIEYEAKE